MILNGKNLGERHRDLNLKVSEAVDKQTNFEELKSLPETCDVDKLIKIDIASKYKNVDYILEVLKCGDTLYITRGLKCLWLYSDEYSQFINPNYLETDIFPYMSIKMKMKMLTTISIHMRNSDRAVDFYKYCLNSKLNNYAIKFLLYMPDEFKLEYLKCSTNLIYLKESKRLKKFIGSSFQIALAYLALYDYTPYRIHTLRFLYSVSEEDYLNILEEHSYSSQRLSIRITKSILIKHKERVFNKPNLYVNVLNENTILKYLTIEEIESFLLALLPESIFLFWLIDFYNTYKFLFRKVPKDNLFTYIKQMYVTKYNDDTFEMRDEFDGLSYYEMFNVDEREAWALQKLERDEEQPDIENYILYKYIRYDKAISGLKRYIFITPDKNTRSEIVNILPETARNEDDLNKILCYYYDRHVNESEEHKESFINKIIELHDIYSFNDECWTLLDKLFYSLEVYTSGSHTRVEYKFRSLFYHCLNDKELPETLRVLVDNICHFYHMESLIKELSDERKAIIAKYLLNYYAEKVKSLMDQPDYEAVKNDNDSWEYDSVKDKIRDLTCQIWNVIYCFKRSEDDCPDIVIQFMESNMSVYQYHEKYKIKFVKVTEEDFVRWLKHDMEMCVDGIAEIRSNTYRWNFRLSRLFRKLRVYFPDDVGKEYLKYFTDYLSDLPDGCREYRNIKMAVVGVYYLAKQDFITSFLDKYVPITPKIDHMNIDNKILQVQKAICRLAYHPRPPLPLSNIQKFITGDYVRFCLPMLYNYMANLACNKQFIETLLNSPVSIQKHGLRLALKVYDAKTLKPIIKSAWNKTKNVSLRRELYKTLFARILRENDEGQAELYEVLKLYTSELNHNDHDDVYSLLISDDFPHVMKGNFIETAWLTVNKLSNKIIDIERRISVIYHMEKYIDWLERDFLRFQIIDDHIDDMLFEENINEDFVKLHVKELIHAKWNLTAKYIVSFKNEIEKQKSLELLETIMFECQESWNLVNQKTYTVRNFLQSFITIIMNKDPKTLQSCEHIVIIYQCILHNLQSFLSKDEIYLMYWRLKLSITSRNIIHNTKIQSDTETHEPRDKFVIRKEMAHAYGKEVANMIINLIKKDEFYRCFYESIADIVINIGCTICDILGVSRCGFNYYVCDMLTDVKITETHLLALFMLPSNPADKWDRKHRETMRKLQQFICPEVQSYLYEKYVLSDCQVRLYVKPRQKKCQNKKKPALRKPIFFVFLILSIIFVVVLMLRFK